jgi:hypothetical protein
MVESMPNLRENSENVKLGGVQVDREMETRESSKKKYGFTELVSLFIEIFFELNAQVDRITENSIFFKNKLSF